MVVREGYYAETGRSERLNSDLAGPERESFIFYGNAPGGNGAFQIAHNSVCLPEKRLDIGKGIVRTELLEKRLGPVAEHEIAHRGDCDFILLGRQVDGNSRRRYHQNNSNASNKFSHKHSRILINLATKGNKKEHQRYDSDTITT